MSHEMYNVGLTSKLIEMKRLFGITVATREKAGLILDIITFFFRVSSDSQKKKKSEYFRFTSKWQSIWS